MHDYSLFLIIKINLKIIAFPISNSVITTVCITISVVIILLIILIVVTFFHIKKKNREEIEFL